MFSCWCTDILNKFFIKSVLIIHMVGVFGGLFAFPPKDVESFTNNTLRLLNTQQYSFLTEYFVQYYPNFKDQKDVGYVRDIVMRIPFADKKEEILLVYINNATEVAPFAYDFYGQLKLFQTNYPEVIKSYQRYNRPERYYYLGLSEKELGNLTLAHEYLLTAVTEITNTELVDSAYLLIAEINLVWKKNLKVREALRKVSSSNHRKWITYYYLYRSEGNQQFLNRVVKMIKGFPVSDPVVKDFLEREKLQAVKRQSNKQ